MVIRPLTICTWIYNTGGGLSLRASNPNQSPHWSLKWWEVFHCFLGRSVHSMEFWECGKKTKKLKTSNCDDQLFFSYSHQNRMWDFPLLHKYSAGKHHQNVISYIIRIISNCTWSLHDTIYTRLYPDFALTLTPQVRRHLQSTLCCMCPKRCPN